MYGTVARTRVKPENRSKLKELFVKQGVADVPGFITSHVLWENGTDTAWLFVIFEDEASYDKNADDPAQDARYQEYRALLEDDPEWHDGQIESAV
jgi:antibiotic biosynthesis monooxygenase (ABM) superfamily enzyme